MIEFKIDSDLVIWVSSFLTSRKIQLVIDANDNKESNIEIEISQSSLILPILFPIYISSVFNKVLEQYPLFTSLSFVDNLGFIALGSSVNELVKTLKNVVKAILE